MNGYALSRQYFDYANANPGKTSPAMCALYMWLIELNNRRRFIENFYFNTEDACYACGISNRKTVWKHLHELADAGLVTIVYKSANSARASVLSIIHNRVEPAPTDGAFDTFGPMGEEGDSEGGLSNKWTGDALQPCPQEPQPAPRPGNAAATQGGYSKKGLKKVNTKNTLNTQKGSPVVFVEPALDEVTLYFETNGYSREAALRCYHTYAVAGWHDTRGQPIKNWKQKCHSVWFKPENIKKSTRITFVQ